MKKQLKNKKYYIARPFAPFKKEDAQEIGKFIENCSDKSTEGILNTIKKNPKSKIYSYIEWDVNKASKLYQLQKVREIINHLEVEVIYLGNKEPMKMEVAIRAFENVSLENSNKREYVSIEKGMTKEYYRKQIISRAKAELKSWIEINRKYKEFARIIEKLDTVKELLVED